MKQGIIKCWIIGNNIWKICSGGMGIYFNPPGDAEYYFHVEDLYQAYSLRQALKSDHVPQVVKEEVKKILKNNREGFNQVFLLRQRS